MSTHENAAIEPPDILVWCDEETTGLVAHHEHLLEVAVLVTDVDLNLLDEVGFERIVHYDQGTVRRFRDNAAPVVRGMHDASGLWDRLSSGQAVDVVDQEMLAYIKQFAPNYRQARFAGNSLRLDMNFADEWLPETAAHMHYQFLDVSGMAFLGKKWAGVPLMDKAYGHTAMADIRESLAELKYLRAHGLFARQHAAVA
ncbi:MAG TPA: oligoribonuclease [Demequina sp.]|nr:oligoribonuclease [Demequina sp.]